MSWWQPRLAGREEGKGWDQGPPAKLNQISYRRLVPSIVTIYHGLPGLNHEENNRVSCLPGFQCGLGEIIKRSGALQSSEIMMLLRQLVLYGKRAPIIGPLECKIPTMGLFCLLLAGSLWHKRAGIATLWSSRPTRAKPRHSSTNESGPHCTEITITHC